MRYIYKLSRSPPFVDSTQINAESNRPPPLLFSQFYYEAIDRTLQEIKEKHPGQGIHLVGHSIGGWVGRAWLAEGCSPADRDSVLSLTTLGTPNTGPPDDAGGPWTAVDQTRGLLKSINSRFPGAHVEGVRYTSVAGTALQGERRGWLGVGGEKRVRCGAFVFRFRFVSSLQKPAPSVLLCVCWGKKYRHAV